MIDIPSFRQARAYHHSIDPLGTGPSAITLSYLLSGHLPHWNGCPVSNEYLNLKLEQYVKDAPLIEQVNPLVVRVDLDRLRSRISSFYPTV